MIAFLRLLVKWFLLLMAVVLVLVLMVVFSPYIAVVLAREALRRRRFLKEYDGVVFFCYSSRRRWNEFVRNNVLAVLPPSVVALQMRGRGRDLGDERRAMLGSEARRVFRSTRHPYLLKAQDRKTKGVSLHETFLPLKQHAARDPRVQELVRELLCSAVGDIEQLSPSEDS